MDEGKMGGFVGLLSSLLLIRISLSSWHVRKEFRKVVHQGT